MYAGCHRYDQSVMSVLAYNMYAFDQSCFGHRDTRPYLEIKKTSIVNNFTIQVCNLQSMRHSIEELIDMSGAGRECISGGMIMLVVMLMNILTLE